MRGRMNDRKSYVPPFELGKPLAGGAVGEVIESRAKEFKPGDVVTSNYGWREYFIASPKELHPVNRQTQPLSVYLGALGMTGMTAWVGLNLVEVKAGDVVFISGAAGAVGNVAGQLAKLRGCRVIGSAGSAEKVRFLRDECGFDVDFNYKAGPMLEQLNLAAPDGIDVYFDNVGGEALEAALSALRVRGRIVACGSISVYNDEKPRPGGIRVEADPERVAQPPRKRLPALEARSRPAGRPAVRGAGAQEGIVGRDPAVAGDPQDLPDEAVLVARRVVGAGASVLRVFCF